MRKQLLVILIGIISLNCFSQISFEKGYFINNKGQKIECLIKNIDWKNNPKDFIYILPKSTEQKKSTIKLVKEFGVYNYSKYIRSTVKIDKSSKNLNNLSTNRNPVFKEEELFLKVLVEGKYNLYEYVESNLKRYFFSINNSNIKQLIFKNYETNKANVGKNNRFRQQLWTELKCPNFKMSKVESLSYKKNELIRFFVEYNNCNNEEYVNFEEKQKRDLFNLALRPRINSSSLAIQNSISNSRDNNFENKFGFGFGIEAEFILPFNKNKWAIAIEPTYQNFKSEKTTNSNHISGGELIAIVNYNSIEIPITLRHYVFLNNNSKIFINTSYVFDLSSKSSIEFTRSNVSSFDSLDISTRSNLAIGIGYKQNDKYILEIRYQTNREVLGNYSFWSSEYKTLSIILGYTLF